MGSSICCFPDKDTKRLSLMQNSYGQSLEVATDFGIEKSSAFDARVLWPKDRQLLTSDLVISKALDKFKASHVSKRNSSVYTETDNDNSFRVSVEVLLDAHSSNMLIDGPREKISTGGLLEAIGNMHFNLSPRIKRQDTTLTAKSSWEPFPMTKVLSNLWIGTFDDANNECDLKFNGITHILSLVGHQSPFEWVERKHYPMDDHGKSTLKVVLEEVSEFIEMGQKGNNRVLVHCQSGQNRSAVVVIALQMIMNKKTLYRAHRELKKLRPIVQVNVEYAKQLLQLERELFNGVNSLPLNWMERESIAESASDICYKHENLNTSRHRLMFNGEEK